MPEVVTTLAAWRERADALRHEGRTLGLVPTMGALHAGHASLFARASDECDVALATVFVNPLQFGDASDLDRYRVDTDADLALAGSCGVGAVFMPSVAEMWPRWPKPTPTSVSVAGLSAVLEGVDRPGHFDGVSTVVTKLLVATGECRAYFGEKDYQQLCVVRQLVDDLALRASVVACPTVREGDGLALSSRNARLTTTGRRSARALSRALDAARLVLESTGRVGDAEAAMRHVVGGEPGITLAYAAIVEPATLRPVGAAAPGTEVRVVIAGVVDAVRLIDNVGAVIGPSA